MAQPRKIRIADGQLGVLSPSVVPDSIQTENEQALIAKMGTSSGKATFEDLGPRISREIRKALASSSPNVKRAQQGH